MQRLRETLALVLLALLPFHALFITVATRMMFGPGHAPWGALALWKEGLLGVIFIFAWLEVTYSALLVTPRTDIRLICRRTMFTFNLWYFIRKCDLIDWLILALTVILLGISASNNVSITALFYGFKYDLFAPLAFIILRRVPWSDRFKTHAESVLLWIGGIVALYGIVTFFLPQSFFSWLGYSDAHSLYMPNGPLAAFQYISESGIRRIQGPMSGPNQLGLWLLIPLSVVLSLIVKRKAGSGEQLAVSKLPATSYLLLALYFLALLLTFSRSSWIAALVILAVSILPRFPRKVVAQIVGASGAIIALGILVLALLAPQVIVRVASSKEHILRPLKAMQMMIEHPLGLGLGSAGPAANRTHEPCVFLEEGADASWASGSPELCVFAGAVQLQPESHACNCAFLPENWYLQIGVEAGWLGFALFAVLTFLILKKLTANSYQLPAFLAFLAISIAALFLHAWEDSAVAYSVWMLAAVALSMGKGARAQA